VIVPACLVNDNVGLFTTQLQQVSVKVGTWLTKASISCCWRAPYSIIIQSSAPRNIVLLCLAIVSCPLVIAQDIIAVDWYIIIAVS